MTLLAALALVAALYDVLNHAMYKGLLFLMRFMSNSHLEKLMESLYT